MPIRTVTDLAKEWCLLQPSIDGEIAPSEDSSVELTYARLGTSALTQTLRSSLRLERPAGGGAEAGCAVPETAYFSLTQVAHLLGDGELQAALRGMLLELCLRAPDIPAPSDVAGQVQVCSGSEGDTAGCCWCWKLNLMKKCTYLLRLYRAKMYWLRTGAR